MFSQGSGGGPKSDVLGNSNLSKHHSRHHKIGSKHAAPPNNIPPFRVPLAYPQAFPPFFHPVISGPHLPVPDYGYQPYPPPFPNVAPHMVNAGCETPLQAFIPSNPPIVGNDANKSFPPPPRGDPSAWHNHGGGYNSQRPNAPESARRFNQGWRHQRGLNPRDNMSARQSVGRKAFSRPVQPFFGPAPGYINGPVFPGGYSGVIDLSRVCYFLSLCFDEIIFSEF